jgi:hypothetical protein
MGLSPVRLWHRAKPCWRHQQARRGVLVAGHHRDGEEADGGAGGGHPAPLADFATANRQAAWANVVSCLYSNFPRNILRLRDCGFTVASPDAWFGAYVDEASAAMNNNKARRKLAYIGLLAAFFILTAGATLFWCFATGTRINLETYQKLSVGLERSEVEAILGCPPGDYSSRGLVPLKNKHLYQRDDWDGKDSYRGEPSEEWCSDEARIRVWFNAEGRVGLMSIHSRLPPDCSAWDRASSLLHLR